MPGLLERIITPRLLSSNPNDDRFWGNGSNQSASGVNVTAESALTYDALFACVRVISEDYATLPVDVIRKRPNGRGRDEIPNHPLDYLFNVAPNAYQTALEYREWMCRVACLYPEAVSEIIPGRRGFAEELRPLHPSWLKKETLPNGTVRYEVKEPKRDKRYLDLSEVFRVPSPLGLGIVQLAKEDVGSALAANKSMGSMWRNGRRGMWGLQHPKALSEAAKENLKASIDQVSGPENTARVLLFEEGMTWVDIGIKPEDAQAIQQMEFSVLRMARWFRMQPHKIAYMINASYNSIEQQNIEHVIDTIRPWVKRFESSAKVYLLPLEQNTYLKHNLNDLLRGDALSRWQVYEIQKRVGARNSNEIRESEDMNPRPDAGGEAYWDLQPGSGGPASSPGSKQSRARALAAAAAQRVVARELSAVRRNAVKFADATDFGAWKAWAAGFYAEHVEAVSVTLALSEGEARAYCDEKRDELIEQGMKAVERWEARDVERLTNLALGDVA